MRIMRMRINENKNLDKNLKIRHLYIISWSSIYLNVYPAYLR